MQFVLARDGGIDKMHCGHNGLKDACQGHCASGFVARVMGLAQSLEGKGLEHFQLLTRQAALAASTVCTSGTTQQQGRGQQRQCRQYAACTVTPPDGASAAAT
jgi:hypothetical protein